MMWLARSAVLEVGLVLVQEIEIAVMTVSLVFFVYCLLPFQVSGLLECSLNYTEKFSPECSDFDIDYPLVIYQNAMFALSIDSSDYCCIFPQNISLFLSTDNYCGPNTFSQGHACIIISQTIGEFNKTITIVSCPDSPLIGQAVLIVGLSDCAFPLNVTWGQTTMISAVETYPGTTINIIRNLYIVHNTTNPFNITCSATPHGPHPMLYIDPLRQNSMASFVPLYQEANSVIVASFPGGLTSQYAAVYTCISLDGYSTRVYLATYQDISSVHYPDGNSLEISVGSPVNITAVLLTEQAVDPTTVQFISINNTNVTRNVIVPTIQTLDMTTFYITYSAVPVLAAGLYEICFGFSEGSGSSDSEMISQCIGLFNLTVTVPSITLLTDLVVRRAADYNDGLVNVSCMPSDPTAFIHWQQLSNVPLWDIYPSYQYEPIGRNHTVKILSPPYGIIIIVCGLLNPGGMPRLLNEQRITLVTVTRPVSVWNNNNELLPNSIINSFRIFFNDGLPFLSLRCFSEDGHGDLQWQTEDVSTLSDNVTLNSTQSLTVIGYSHDSTLNYAEFDANKTGYYICKSYESGEEVRVFTTFDDPYWDVLAPSYIEIPIGTNFTIKAQYAYASEGYGNLGVGFTFDLDVIPTNPQLPDYSVFTNILSVDNGYTYNYSFTISTSDTADFVFQANADMFNLTLSETVRVQAIIPVFTSVSTPVYALLGRTVNLFCTPNDTRAPVNWGISNEEENYEPLNNEPTFVFSPANLDHNIDFNLTTATFSDPEYYRDIDSGSYSQLSFVCGFRNGSRSSFTSPSYITLNIETDPITVSNVLGNVRLRNNSIVNRFNFISKREVVNMKNFRVRCTTVQGDHNPLFKVEFFDNPGNEIVITNYSIYLYTLQSNPYQSFLIANVTSSISGKYNCQSTVSGLFSTFIIAAENPFVRTDSNKNVTAFLGDNVTMIFLAARNSIGNSNVLSSLQGYFMADNGSNSTFNVNQNCGNKDESICYQYRYSINKIRPQHAGVYYARVLGDCEIITPDCYVNDSVVVSVEVPQLIPSHTTLTVYVGNPLLLSCVPSAGNFIISWQHNGVMIPGYDCENIQKRNALLSCLYPSPYNTHLRLAAAFPSDTGIYTCSLLVNNEVILLKQINVSVITAPSVNISSTLIVKRSRDFENGLISVTCTPSDPSAVIYWQLLNSTALYETYPSYQFEPEGLNHTVKLLSAPDGIATFVCGVYSPGGFELINEQQVTVVTVSRPVSLWNNGFEIFESAIINQFTPSHFLSLQCYGEEGHNNLRWQTEEVQFLPTNITDEVISSDPFLSVMTANYYTQLNISNLNGNKTGYYICRSDQSGLDFRVLIVLDDPYWKILSPPYIEAPIGVNLTLTGQYAYESKGYGNTGYGLLLSLSVTPNTKNLPAYTVFKNITSDSNIYSYNHTFTVSTSDDADFNFQAVRNFTEFSFTLQVLPIIPMFTSVSTPVYALFGRIVNMFCTPNDTSAPVNWGVLNYEEYLPLNNEPTFVFSPQNLDHNVSFNLTSATFSNLEYSLDSDSGRLRFVCGFRNGSNPSLFINSKNLILNIEQDVITITDSNTQVITNNSIVNTFLSDHKREIGYEQSFEALCTVVQGDHNPIFKAEFFASPGNEVVLDYDYLYYNGDLSTEHLNVYQSRLIADVNENISGRYQCRSTVSGVFSNFILTPENPFVRTDSNKTVTAFLGDNVTMIFLAAKDSDGNSNGLSSLQGYFMADNGSNSIFKVNQNCGNNDESIFCYQYRYSINKIRPQHAGIYYAGLTIDECVGGNCYVNDSVNVTVEVPQLLRTSAVTNAFVGNNIFLSCRPSQGNFVINWQHNGRTITAGVCNTESLTETCFYPEQYNNVFFLHGVTLDDSGSYTCSLLVDNEVILSQQINVTITEAFACYREATPCGQYIATANSIEQCCNQYNGVAYARVNNNDFDREVSTLPPPQCTPCVRTCPEDFSNGILWETTVASTLVTVPCTQAGNQFRSGLVASRQCYSVARWGPVDFTKCLLKQDAGNSATIWVTLDVDSIEQIRSKQTSLENNLLSSFPAQMRAFLDDLNIPYDIVNIQSLYLSSVLVQFHVALPTLNESTTEALMQVSTDLSRSTTFAGFTAIPQNSGIQVYQTAESCPCQMTQQQENFVILCSGGATRPCDCVNNTCQCQSPFVGDGVLCTLDSDGDSYPENILNSCTNNSTETYCIKDNCPNVYNPDQNQTACQTLPLFSGCSFGADDTWGILWTNTPVGVTDRQPCPGQADTLGSATRTCIGVNEWGDPNVLSCLPVEYQNYLNQANDIFSANESIEVQLTQIAPVISNLADTTAQTLPNQVSLLPASLNATNYIVNGAIDLLFDSLDNNTANITDSLVDSLNILDIFNNLLNNNHSIGWNQLQSSSTNTALGSNVLLQNAERYGLYFALARNDTVKRRQNIAIRAKRYAVSRGSALTFPQPGDLDNTLFTGRTASVSIPNELLSERAKNTGRVPVVSILFQNLEYFLETAQRNRSNNTRPASLLWSGQVSQLTGNIKNPINLTFGIDNSTDVSRYICVYWDENIQGWSNDGVETVRNFTDSNGQTLVSCESFHLTAFAVLVDVSGSVHQTSPGELTALKVVSYIGCAISIACLVITVIFFAIQGKVLFTSVHFFVHLNLAISLLCAYFIFAVGVETARGSQGGCAFVAALLHYFFLASFCWMLCEGVMLYLMLIIVFSRMAKRWWLFLLLGWLTPVLPVVIGLAAGYSGYGVRNEEGDLLYCWLSVDNGVIWAFVAPMIIIIIINIVFLVLALVRIWRTRSNQLSRRSHHEQKGSTRQIALGVLKASIILLPLLGLTWLFGLLAVNENTTVFAWIFTILNSLQGAAIFFFHVVRSEKVWSKVSPQLKRIKGRATMKTRSYQFTSKDSQSTLKSRSSHNDTIKLNIQKAYSGEEKSDPSMEDRYITQSTALASLSEKIPLKDSDDQEERARQKEKEAFGTVDEDSKMEDDAIIHCNEDCV